MKQIKTGHNVHNCDVKFSVHGIKVLKKFSLKSTNGTIRKLNITA